MRRWVILPIMAVAGVFAAMSIAGHENDVELHPWQTVVTLNGTITDSDPVPHPVTVMVTSGSTSPSPPPVQNDCSNVMEPGGDLSAFLAVLPSGAVACLKSGQYSDPPQVGFPSGVTVKSYPGEVATITGTRVVLSGTGQKLLNLRIMDVLFADGESVTVSGSDALVEGNEFGNNAEHGVLLGSASTSATINRNYIHDVGGDTLDHGIYVQGTGHKITNNLILRPSGYGLHFYSKCNASMASQNTMAGSKLRAGVLVRCETGSLGPVTLVNNILYANATHGINFHSCVGGCLIDKNVAWQNPSGSISSAGAAYAAGVSTVDPRLDANYSLMLGSPAINYARTDYSFSPDRLGVPRDSLPDIGAHEYR